MSALTHSLEDGDITIFRLLWLCRCLDLMQGQHVWALSNIRVKELDIGGQLLHFHILIFCLHIQMSHLVCLLIIRQCVTILRCGGFRKMKCGWEKEYSC